LLGSDVQLDAPTTKTLLLRGKGLGTDEMAG
jgi:hypothetical protein